jgi:hypothetical protein
VPKAVAYHYRGMFGKEKSGVWGRIKNRRKKSRTRSYFSNRNQWNMLTKNELLWNAFLAFPRLFVHESARFLYVVLFEMSTFKAFVEAVLRTPVMLKKRRHTLSRRKATAKELRAWFR